VQALTESEVAFIPRDAVKKLAFERPNVGLAMWLETLVEGSIFREWIANVGRRDARSRIAHLLCEFSLRLKVAGLGEATDYELPMTQEQVADTTGLTPVHVNRTLKSLEAENLITRRNSRSIVIGDWKKLAEAGDFDSGYLHLRKDDPALA
jgi:CRP-like cAMP-binding protein